MAFRKPQVRLNQMLFLVTVLAVEFAALPRPASTGVAALTLGAAAMASVAGPLPRAEWAIIAAIHAILIALLLPALKHSGGPRPGSAKTTRAALR